jgi:hypothetical protein
MVLRKISGAEREEVTGGWVKLRNDKLNDFYFSPSFISRIQIKENVMVGACRVFVKKRPRKT